MFITEVSGSDGVVLRVCVANTQSDAPWIAFVLPFGLPLQFAEPFIRYFGVHFRILCWESRLILSETATAPADVQLTLTCHAADVIELFRHFDIQRAYLVGHCSGAGVAMKFAQMHAEQVSGMVLVHGEYVLRQMPECVTPFADEIDTLLSLCNLSESSLDLVFDKVSENRRPVAADLPVGIDTPFTERAYLRNYARNYLQYKTTDFCRLAADVQTDVLLLCGGADIQTNIQSSKKLQACFSHAQLVIDQDADHYGVYRDDSTTLTHIWNYLYEQECAI